MEKDLWTARSLDENKALCVIITNKKTIIKKFHIRCINVLVCKKHYIFKSMISFDIRTIQKLSAFNIKYI